ncbi:antirepressor [Clostridium perfringens]|nr:Rha family transcriptional regulator [Clostridium perfringens]SQB35308.1 antirepressor [Clostridium perfringens]
MNDLVIFESKEIEGVKLSNQNGQLVVSSRQIAEDFEKEHRNVLQSIEEIKKGVAEKSADLFIESEYQHPQNKQWYKEYLMNRDGFTLLAMGFNGDKALQWKLKYIEAFNKMEQALKEQRKPTSAIDLFEAQVQAFKEVRKQINEVNHKALEAKAKSEKLEERMDNQTLSTAQTKKIKKIANNLAVPLVGGKGSKAYKPMIRKVYKDIYKQLFRELGVNASDEIKVKDFNFALEVMNNYKVATALKNEIDIINNQGQMSI